MRYYTDKELKEKLKETVVIVDTREQQNQHILGYFDKKGIPYIKRKLDIGDYACQLGDESYEREFVIEKKFGLDELCGNLTNDRDRFEREFLRAKAYNTKVYLLIENATWNDVYTHNYQSRLESKALLASILSWQSRFNITVIMCGKDVSAEILYGILYYAVREKVLS